MKFTISDKFLTKLNKGVKLREWWFTNHTAKKMWKRIEKIYKTYYKQTHSITPIEQLRIYPEDFKKLPNETIECGLNLFVKQGGLKSWNKQTVQNADIYLVVFNNENRSQERFSNTKNTILSRIPQEIDLNSVNVEPITQSPEDVHTSSETNNETPTNTNIKVDSTSLINPEQEIYEDDAENFEAEYAEDDYDNPGSPF